MAVIEIDRDPSPATLKWFGVVVLAFFCLVGLIARLNDVSGQVASWICAAGGVIAAVYYAVPSLRRSLYLGWMHLVYPIGWTVSHVLLGLAYYGVITPIGLGLRLSGRDPMKRRLYRSRASYWIQRPPNRDSSRYFRQF